MMRCLVGIRGPSLMRMVIVCFLGAQAPEEAPKDAAAAVMP